MASFIWNRAAGTCAGSAYGIVCRIIIAIIVRQVVPNYGIIYSILPVMNTVCGRSLRADGHLYSEMKSGILLNDSRLSDV